MLERIKIQRQLWVKGSFQFFLTTRDECHALSAFISPTYPGRSGDCYSPGQARGARGTGNSCAECRAQPQSRAWGLPGSPGNSEASLNKHWQTTHFANTFTCLLLMLTPGMLGSAVLSPARTLMGFFPCLTAHLTIYLNGFLASLLSSHAKSTYTS